jgi:hypothetical protein
VSEVDLSEFQAECACECVIPFSIFLWSTKSGDQPQEDLAKSGYKTKNKEEEKSRNHIGEPLKPVSVKYGDIKRRKLEICQNTPKFLAIS